MYVRKNHILNETKEKTRTKVVIRSESLKVEKTTTAKITQPLDNNNNKKVTFYDLQNVSIYK